MKLKRFLIIALAAVSAASLVSCSKKVCDYCKINEPTENVELDQKYRLCDACYVRVVNIETEQDVIDTANTAFEALTLEQKIHIVMWIESVCGRYDAMLGMNVDNELLSEVFEDAATRYNKTPEQIKTIWDEDNTKKVPSTLS